MLFLGSWVPNSQKVPRLLAGYSHLPAAGRPNSEEPSLFSLTGSILTDRL